MVAPRRLSFERASDEPSEDHIVVLHGIAWQDFEHILELRGDRSAPRVSYLEGELELMSPSENHELLKSRIGRLVEAYCLFAGIEFEALGSWTLKRKRKKAGLEPDECYVFGVEKKKRPDLAIEVVWTSGGVDKLEIYRRLGVEEVWTWERGNLQAQALGEDGYREISRSQVLPGIDLVQLASFLDRPTASAAIREYRDALEGKKKRAPRARRAASSRRRASKRQR